MSQIHQVCSNGHEVASYKGHETCPVFVKGKPCPGELVSAKTKKAKEYLTKSKEPAPRVLPRPKK